MTLWPRNLNVDQQVHDAAKGMVRGYSNTQIKANGMTVRDYGLQLVNGTLVQLGSNGDGDPKILRNYSGLRHVVGELTESASSAVTPAEKADIKLLNKRRVQVGISSVKGTISYLLQQRGPVSILASGAAARATDLGARRAGTIYFGGQDDKIPTSPSLIASPPPCGYQLTAAQYTSLKSTLSLHQINAVPNATGARVSMAQSQRGLIPLLLDARSSDRLTTATALATC